MSLPSPAALRSARVGNDAGWLLAFHRETPDGAVVATPDLWFGSDDAHAEIQATLPGGLEGGVYRFVVERMAEDDYARLAAAPRGRRTLGVVKLYLFWRDALGGVTDYLTGLAGLAGLGDITPTTAGGDPVAVLAVTGLSRAVGARGVETTITARERVFAHLDDHSLCGTGPGLDLASLDTAISTALQGLALAADATTYPLTPNDRCPATPSSTPGGRRQQLPYGTGGVEALRMLASRIEEQTRRRGRGMLLIRNGTLHIGPRPIPLVAADGVKDLSVESGLVDSQPLESVTTDPKHDRCANPGQDPTQRRQYRLTCKGRPDLRPGDVVRFGIPQEDADPAGFGVAGLLAAAVSGPLLPSLGGVTEPSMKLYVNSVDHRLGRTSGFVTTVTGVELRDDVGDWDCHSPARGRAPDRSSGEAAGAATEAARAVRAVGEDAAARQAPVEAGEVRAVTTTAGDQPAQTLQVWRRLQDGDGDANQASRIDVARPSPAPATGAPYLTPFAFGKAGLVLPCYPGMRIAVAHRQGNEDDPLVAGALWTAGDAPDSQAGDWWLILPSAVPSGERRSKPDSDTATPTAYSGDASNDLIDADGNRVIEAGELTIRIGAGALAPAGTRPERAADANSVTIEHADGGSKIVMESGGKIRIEAGADLEIKATNVKFQVSGTVDVS